MQSTESTAKSAISRQFLVIILLVAILLGVMTNLFLKTPIEEPSQTAPLQLSSGTWIPNPRPLSSFSLTDHTGQIFSQQSIKGRWHLLSFGYTHCPDICPTTLAMLAQLDDRLNKNESVPAIQTTFISIDPQRDTVEKLARYMPYFNKTFTGVTGNITELNKLTQQLGVLYARVDADGSELEYLMDHSSSIILINPEGGFQAVFSAPHDVGLMAEDLIKITLR